MAGLDLQMWTQILLLKAVENTSFPGLLTLHKKKGDKDFYWNKSQEKIFWNSKKNQFKFNQSECSVVFTNSRLMSFSTDYLK